MRKSIATLSSIAVAVAIAVAAPSAHAASDYFLKLDGIPGESVAPGMTGAVDVLSYTWGVEAPVSMTGVPAPARAKPGQLTINKTVDSTSPVLFGRMVQGASIAAIELVGRRAGSSTPFLRYCFQNAVVVAQTHAAADGDETPAETVSFLYSSVGQQYTRATGQSVFAAWNVATNALSTTSGAVCRV